MNKKSAAVALILAFASLSLAGCTSTGNPHIYQGQPVGGFVQEHGGANPEPVVWPTTIGGGY